MSIFPLDFVTASDAFFTGVYVMTLVTTLAWGFRASIAGFTSAIRPTAKDFT